MSSIDDPKLSVLVSMGFDVTKSMQYLKHFNNNLEHAIEGIINNVLDFTNTNTDDPKNDEPSSEESETEESEEEDVSNVRKFKRMQKSKFKNPEKPIDYIKCCILGDDTIGKTCLLITYANNSFPDEYVPTVFDNYNATVLYDKKHITLSLWDTAGQEDYDRLRPLCFPETNVFLICFSIVDRSSFKAVKTKWYPEMMEHSNGNIPFVLIGLKDDLRDDDETKRELKRNGEKMVTIEEGENCARELDAMIYCECSSKKIKGLKDVFVNVMKSVLDPESFEVEEEINCIVGLKSTLKNEKYVDLKVTCQIICKEK